MRWMQLSAVCVMLAFLLAGVPAVAQQDAASLRYSQAIEKRAERDYWGAMMDFSDVIVNWPVHELAPYAHLELARTSFTVYMPEIGRPELDKIPENYPHSPARQPAALEWGKQHLEDDNAQYARAAFLNCIEMYPDITEDSLEARFYLACLDANEGLVDEAAQQFRSISQDDIELNGEMHNCGARAELQLGKTLAGQGHYEDAAGVFSALLIDAEGWDRIPEVRFNLALVLLKLGQVDQAKEHLNGILDDYSNCEYVTSARRVLAKLAQQPQG